MEISICCLALANCQKVIVMEFCTLRNGWAVVACAELGRHLIPYDEVTKTNFPSNLNYDGKNIHEIGPLIHC